MHSAKAITDENRSLKIGYTEGNNMPALIAHEGGTIMNRYSFGGQKLGRSFTDAMGQLVSDETYYGSLVMEQRDPSRILFEDGYIDLTPGQRPVFNYHLKDHLGNVRIVLRPGGLYGRLVQSNDYFPFGMAYTKERMSIKIPDVISLYDDNSYTAESPTYSKDNRYLYNGKEEQPMPGKWLVPKAFGRGRFYDAQLGRWHSVDPACEDGGQESVTPYGYVLNDPIKHKDPDGRFPLLSNIIGAAAGAVVEYGGQVAANVIENGWSKSAFTDNIDVGDITLAAGEGFLTSGGSVVKNALLKTTIAVGAEVARNYLDVKTSSDGTGLEVKTNDAGTTLTNTAFGLTVGKIGDAAPAPKKKVMDAPTPKQAVSKARADAKTNGTTVNRQQRIATENKAKQGQQTAASVNNTTAKIFQNTVASGASETIKQQTNEKR